MTSEQEEAKKKKKITQLSCQINNIGQSRKFC